RATARGAAERRRLRARYGPAVRAYTDTAWLFLLAGCELVRPDGRVVLVQPRSVVAARDAAAVRAAVGQRAALVDLWLDERRASGRSVPPAGAPTGTGVARWPGRRPSRRWTSARARCWATWRPSSPASGTSTTGWSAPCGSTTARAATAPPGTGPRRPAW